MMVYGCANFLLSKAYRVFERFEADLLTIYDLETDLELDWSISGSYGLIRSWPKIRPKERQSISNLGILDAVLVVNGAHLDSG